MSRPNAIAAPRDAETSRETTFAEAMGRMGYGSPPDAATWNETRRSLRAWLDLWAGPQRRGAE